MPRQEQWQTCMSAVHEGRGSSGQASGWTYMNNNLLSWLPCTVNDAGRQVFVFSDRAIGRPCGNESVKPSLCRVGTMLGFTVI